jgi:hypothetical protein
MLPLFLFLFTLTEHTYNILYIILVERHSWSPHCFRSVEGLVWGAVYGAQESIPRNEFRSLCSLAGRYDNPIPTRSLAPIDCLKIPVQEYYILYSVQSWNSWKYNFVDISGNNLEINHTWGSYLCLCLNVFLKSDIHEKTLVFFIDSDSYGFSLGLPPSNSF